MIAKEIQVMFMNVQTRGGPPCLSETFAIAVKDSLTRNGADRPAKNAIFLQLHSQITINSATMRLRKSDSASSCTVYSV